MLAFKLNQGILWLVVSSQPLRAARDVALTRAHNDIFFRQSVRVGTALHRRSPLIVMSLAQILLNQTSWFSTESPLLLAWNSMHVFEVSAQVATLCKGFVALWAAKRPETSMLTEMVTQVATLLECRSATRVLALKEKLNTLRMRILDLDRLVPFFWNALEMFRRKILMRFDPVIVVDHIFIFIRIVRFIVF